MATPRVVRLTVKAYNQSMNDSSVFVQDVIDVRVGRAAGLTSVPVVNSLCANASFALNGSNVSFSADWGLDTLLEEYYLTLTSPGSVAYNLTPYAASADSLVQHRNYSFVLNETGNWTVAAGAADLENRSASAVVWVNSSNELVSFSFSVSGFNVSELDGCGRPVQNGVALSYLRPPGVVSVEARAGGTYGEPVRVLFENLSVAANSSGGTALNFSSTLGTLLFRAVPEGYRAVAQFEVNSSLSNYSGVVVVYNYSPIYQGIYNPGLISVFKCGSTACVQANQTFTVDQDAKTISFRPLGFSVFSVAELGVVSVAGATNTITTTATTVVRAGGSSGKTEVPYNVTVREIRAVSIIRSPGNIEVFGNQSLLIPITLQNNEDFTITGITLEGSAGEGMALTLDPVFVRELKPGDKAIVIGTINGTIFEGLHNFTVTARAKNPAFNETAVIFANVKPVPGSFSRESMTQMVVLARDLFRQNPECLELTEFIKRAEEAAASGDSVEAKRILDQALYSCRDLISAAKAPSTPPVEAAIIITREQLPFAQVAAAVAAALLVAVVAYYARKSRNAKLDFPARGRLPQFEQARKQQQKRKWPY